MADEKTLELLDLPGDALTYLLVDLDDTLALLRMMATCHQLHTLLSDESVYHLLLAKRQRQSSTYTPWSSCTTRPWRAAFVDHWLSARDAIRNLDALRNLDVGSTSAERNVCSPPMSGAVAVMTKDELDERVSVGAFMLGVQAVHDVLACGRIALSDLRDWLATRSASAQPLRLLAVLFLLFRSVANRLCAPPALAEPGRRVSLKFYTFSQRRDCRGFRARDDVHSLSASLSELAAQPEHALWRTLDRGVVNEVRHVSVGVCW